MSSAPQWVKELSSGDFFVVVFPQTNNTLYSKVLENVPRSDNDQYLGTLTIQYKLNSFTKQDELLYDDYSQDPSSANHWYAHIIV